MAIQFDRQGNYSRRLEAGLKVPKSWVLSVECALCAVAGNCIPAPKGRWQLPLSNIDETEGPRRGKEKYSQTLDSLSEYFMTDKWKRLHLVHFLLKIRGKIKGQRTFIPKAQKSWHLAKIIKNCGATTPTFTNWLKMSCTCPVKPFSAICQTLHFKQTCWINFEPPPQWETGNLKALCLQPLTSLSKIAMNFRSLLVSNSLYKQDCVRVRVIDMSCGVSKKTLLYHPLLQIGRAKRIF